MDWISFAGVLVALSGLGLAAAWWLPRRGRLLAAAAFLLAIQLLIWVLAEQLDQGVPWNPDRPLLTTPSDGWLFQLVVFLLLYAPLAIAVGLVWKAWRLREAHEQTAL